MRLPTTTSASADYPDLPTEAPLCVEVTSAQPWQPLECLAEEVRALCAASLILQLETGTPVIKLLNLTALVAQADQPGARALEPVLNYLGALVEDPAFAPLTLLRSTITQFGDHRFAALPEALERIDGFVRAVGMDNSLPQLSRPSIHLSLDQPEAPGALAGGVRFGAASPVSLRAVALWWARQDVSSVSRLCRPDADRDLLGPRGLAPLPYLREAFPDAEGDQPTVATAVLPATRQGPRMGFSVRARPDAVTRDDYPALVIARVLDEVAGLLPSPAPAS